MAIKLAEVVSEINTLGDDSISLNIVVNWVNDAIAYMNGELGADFPYVDSAQGDRGFVFPDKWVRMCVIPFGVARLKQMDSSVDEASRFYQQFNDNLALMKFKYTVPDEYKDNDPTLQDQAASDIFTSPSIRHLGWF